MEGDGAKDGLVVDPLAAAGWKPEQGRGPSPRPGRSRGYGKCGIVGGLSGG
jgi:hypothetical protein